jgi:hypothetical protein
MTIDNSLRGDSVRTYSLAAVFRVLVSEVCSIRVKLSIAQSLWPLPEPYGPVVARRSRELQECSDVERMV